MFKGMEESAIDPGQESGSERLPDHEPSCAAPRAWRGTWLRRMGETLEEEVSGGCSLSLELARIILEVTSEDHAKRLLDLGSGFSSCVLRAYAAGVSGAVMWSVDDDPAWLEKARTRQVTDRIGAVFRLGRTSASTDEPGR